MEKVQEHAMLLGARLPCLRTNEAFSGVQGEGTPGAGRGDEVREASLAMGVLPSALKGTQVMRVFSPREWSDLVHVDRSLWLPLASTRLQGERGQQEEQVRGDSTSQVRDADLEQMVDRE